jgi:ornithine decarboxylase
MRVDGEQMMCLHPIKSPEFVARLGNAGVRYLAADSVAEVRKIAALAPASRVLIRMDIGGSGSLVPLGSKFGCRPVEAVELVRVVRKHGLGFAGVTLHVGSQCQSMVAWKESLDQCRALCAHLAKSGSPCEIISLGGGLPVPYTSGVPTLESIGELVMRADLASVGAPGCRLTIEPGRALVATAGTIVTSVVGTAEREGVTWVYLDAGIFHGLMEFLPAAGGFRLPVIVEESGAPRNLQPHRLAGPTCDSLDVLPGQFLLPSLVAGDRIAFGCAGAYSSAVATSFNGFAPPHTVFVHQ